MTAAEAGPRSLGDSLGDHLLLERVATGDALVLSTLYDAFTAETYAICWFKFMMPSSADKAMV
ncbi:hypothetical protein [Cryobacterium sp. CG_9.6]|uniref:hypothetical protein n=1 Tax=Cryobacterium sp. CG_9.6 TaxID=2760710 RepID=UPI00247332FA|nr:hypothetical protein [Cryobacterium sp. CG_9.6]MDH6238491.1 hypothetical protein [Cryobacterium sp. CG_9.6]